MPKLEACRADVLLKVVEGLALDVYRARVSVIRQVAELSVCLQSVEIRQAVFPRPRRCTASSPAVVVLGLPSQGKRRVGAGAAADNPTAGNSASSLPVEIVPVVFLDAAALPHVANGVGNPYPRVGPGFEQEHLEGRIFTQPAGDDPAT